MFKPSYIDSLFFYIFIGIFSLFFALLAEKTKKAKLKKTYLFISGFILFIALGTRYEVSNDYPIYISVFQQAEFDNYLGFSFQEPGYFLLNCIVKLFTNDYRLIFTITAAITISYIYTTFYYLRNRINITIAVLGYLCTFYYVSFCLLRISLAASLMFFALKYILEDKKTKFYISLVIATSIHYSTILWLPVMIGYYLIKKNKINFFWGFAIFYFIILNSQAFLPYIGLVRYQEYLDNNTSTNVGFAFLFYYIPILFLIWYLHKRKKLQTNEYAILLSMAILQTINYYAHYTFQATGRSYLTFTYIVIYLVPYGIKNTKGNMHIFLILFFILYFIMCLWLKSIAFYDPEGLNIFPYKSYLFEI